MVVLEVDVIKLWIANCCVLELVEPLGDVALGIKVVRSDLSNVHIDQVGVVSVDVHHLLLIAAIDIDWVLYIEDFVRKDHIGVTMLVSRGVHVIKLQVSLFLLLIDLEEEVFPRDHLVVGVCGESLLRNLLLEFDGLDFFRDDAVDLLLELALSLTGSRSVEWCVSAWSCTGRLECVKVSSLFVIFCGLFLQLLCGVLPKC